MTPAATKAAVEGKINAEFNVSSNVLGSICTYSGDRNDNGSCFLRAATMTEWSYGWWYPYYKSDYPSDLCGLLIDKYGQIWTSTIQTKVSYSGAPEEVFSYGNYMIYKYASSSNGTRTIASSYVTYNEGRPVLHTINNLSYSNSVFYYIVGVANNYIVLCNNSSNAFHYVLLTGQSMITINSYPNNYVCDRFIYNNYLYIVTSNGSSAPSGTSMYTYTVYRARPSSGASWNNIGTFSAIGRISNAMGGDANIEREGIHTASYAYRYYRDAGNNQFYVRFGSSVYKSSLSTQDVIIGTYKVINNQYICRISTNAYDRTEVLVYNIPSLSLYKTIILPVSITNFSQMYSQAYGVKTSDGPYLPLRDGPRQFLLNVLDESLLAVNTFGDVRSDNSWINTFFNPYTNIYVVCQNIGKGSYFMLMTSSFATNNKEMFKK